jgi:hypothetical protein
VQEAASPTCIHAALGKGRVPADLEAALCLHRHTKPTPCQDVVGPQSHDGLCSATAVSRTTQHAGTNMLCDVDTPTMCYGNTVTTDVLMCICAQGATMLLAPISPSTAAVHSNIMHNCEQLHQATLCQQLTQHALQPGAAAVPCPQHAGWQTEQHTTALQP